MEVLDEIQLKALEAHKYNSSGSSLVDPLIQIFWRGLVEIFPTWIASNTLTISGLAVNIATSFLFMFHCPTATETAPRWVYFVNALGLFTYQSLDAIDGKQARRTGSSSPLGELFDHGCDSISTVFLALAACISMQFGNHPRAMGVLCINSYVVFYCAHWCSYITGVLQFGKIDVTEVQIISIIIFIITGILGSGVWDRLLPVVQIPLRNVMISVWILGLTVTMLRFALIIFFSGYDATIAGTNVLSPGLNVGIILVFALVIVIQSKNDLYKKHLLLYLLYIGIVCAKMTNRLVVAGMTRSALPLLDITLFGMLLLLLNQLFGYKFKEHFFLWISLVFSCVDLLLYLIFTYSQIASHLQIYIFSVESRTVQSY